MATLPAPIIGRILRPTGLIAALVVLLLTFTALSGPLATATANHNDDEPPRVPPVAGFYNQRDIFFIHTEASDPQVAKMLTDMMDSPVPVVPELAQVPADTLADVFVFTNGVQPDGPRGPFGFQPDVFDSAPSDDDYTPLRQLNLVTWQDESQARTLRSDAQIKAMQRAGKIEVDTTQTVVNMPFLTWPTGQR